MEFKNNGGKAGQYFKVTCVETRESTWQPTEALTRFQRKLVADKTPEDMGGCRGN